MMDPLVQFCIMASLYLHLFNAEFLTEGVGFLLKSKNTRLKATRYPPQSHRVSPSPASGRGHGYSCRDALTTGPMWAAAGRGGPRPVALRACPLMNRTHSENVNGQPLLHFG